MKQEQILSRYSKLNYCGWFTAYGFSKMDKIARYLGTNVRQIPGPDVNKSFLYFVHFTDQIFLSVF